MFSKCPRCEAGKLNSSGSCLKCGYTLRLPCNCCGSLNIPFAKFCGNCGYGTSFAVRIKTRINAQLNFFQQMRVKKFATGAAFGTILAIFAFGANGMMVKRSPELPHLTVLEKSSNINSYQSGFARNCMRVIDKAFSAQILTKKASPEDLEAVMNVLLPHLESISRKTNKTRFPAGNFAHYRYALANFPKTRKLSRSGAAMVFYHIMADFLEASYRDFPKESAYSDIPKFHFLAVPATALKQNGFNIGRNRKEFGLTDQISLEKLKELANSLLLLVEKKLLNDQIVVQSK